MELHARLREEATSGERCPYCHDALGADGFRGDRIECPGCATTHHRACIAELGRCTIRGCERPLSVPVEAPAEVGGRHSAFYREVQGRIRTRVRAFVRGHCRATDPPGELVERRDAALRQAEVAEAERDLEAAAEWYHEVARLQRTARPEELSFAQRTDLADVLTAHATRLDRLAALRAVRLAAVKIISLLMACVVFLVVLWIAAGLRLP